MKEVDRLEDQLKRVWERDAWYGPSLKELLSDVTAEMAAARPKLGPHSIWEIVLHIAAWEKAVRDRISGNNVQLSDEEDYPAVKDTSESAWISTLQALENSNMELRKIITGLTDSQLEDKVSGRDYTIYYLIQGAIQHDIYHAGKIALLKRAWK